MICAPFSMLISNFLSPGGDQVRNEIKKMLDQKKKIIIEIFNRFVGKK
jgi:hypothetical protein